MGGRYEVGIDPRNPLDYIGTQYSWAPIIKANRQPLTSDTNYPLFTFWRVSVGLNNSPPLTGQEGEFWYLSKFDNTNGNAIWILLTGGSSPSVLYLNLDAGITPIAPDALGNINLTGALVSVTTVGSNVIRTVGTSSDTSTFQIQQAGSNPSTPDATKYGVCQFDANQFTVTNGYVQLQSDVVFEWIDISGAFSASSGTGYFITGAATATLPASPSQGDRIQFIVDTTSTLVITANTGQAIRAANSITSTAGTLTSTLRGDAINLVYRSSAATWYADSSQCGTWLPA